jgi:hypothetical protein
MPGSVRKPSEHAEEPAHAAALTGAAAVSLPGGLILKAKTVLQRGQRSRAACARVKRSDCAEYRLAWGSANQRAGEISTKDACV